MKKIGKNLLYILTLSLFLSANAFAAVSFEALVDGKSVREKTISEEDSVILSLVVSSDESIDGEHPALPGLEGFEVMNSYTSSSTRSVFQNGKFQMQRQQVYNYTLMPQKKGELLIGKAIFEIKGNTLETQPIKIKVVAGGGGGNSPGQRQSPQAQNPRGNLRNQPRQQQRQQQPQDDDQIPGGAIPGFDDEDDLFAQLLRRQGFLLDPRGGVRSAPQADKNAFFITVEANKKRAYVGEQIVATWSLYTKGQITSFESLKFPDLKGFWKEDLEMAKRLEFQKETINGVTYNKAVLVSYALFPISAGKKTIDQYKAKATVIDSSQAGGMAVFGFGRPYNYTKASQELPIDVMELPTNGKPASFSGAVGKFTITGSLSASTVKANQPVSLKIRFSGKGNVKAIELPALNMPSGLEVYDTKKESQYNKSGDGFIEFEVLLIPRTVGDLTIPGIPLSFFDPQTAKYVTQNTPEFKLKVTQGDASQNNFSSPMSADNSQSPVVAKDIRFLKTASSLALPKNISQSLWFLGFVLPLLWIFIVWRRMKQQMRHGARDDLKKRAKAKLKEARRKIGQSDWRGAGVEISNAVLSVLGEVSGSGGASLTAAEMLGKIALKEKAADEKFQAKVLDLMSRCELISFAPEEMMQEDSKPSAKTVQKMLGESEKIIESLLSFLQPSGESK